MQEAEQQKQQRQAPARRDSMGGFLHWPASSSCGSTKLVRSAMTQYRQHHVLPLSAASKQQRDQHQVMTDQLDHGSWTDEDLLPWTQTGARRSTLCSWLMRKATNQVLYWPVLQQALKTSGNPHLLQAAFPPSAEAYVQVWGRGL